MQPAKPEMVNEILRRIHSKHRTILENYYHYSERSFTTFTKIFYKDRTTLFA